MQSSIPVDRYSDLPNEKHGFSIGTCKSGLCSRFWENVVYKLRILRQCAQYQIPSDGNIALRLYRLSDIEENDVSFFGADENGL